MFIYSRFEALIHETGVTKASIARRIGRTPTVCQDWKAGKSEPSADQLQIVAAALGTTPAYLTGATDKKTLPTGAPSGVMFRMEPYSLASRISVTMRSMSAFSFGSFLWKYSMVIA